MNNLDDFSLQEDQQSLGSGFVIAPQNESVSIITDEFEASVSSGSTQDTPLAQIIGRFNFFGKVTRVRKSSSKSKMSFDPSTLGSGGDIFKDNPDQDLGSKVNFMFDMPTDPSHPRRSRTPGGVIDLGVGRQAKDFTKDDPMDMTYGRRIALALVSKRWYNPKVVKVKPMNSSESKDGSVEEKNNSPSLEQGWGYFEHVTLPRYIVESIRSKSMVGRCCSRVDLLNAKLEKAEPGESHLQSQLYDPFFTALDQLGDFGLGFGLYFSTLRAIALVTFIAGLVSIPNMLYFSGKEYSNGQEGVFWALKGSAICTDLEYVPCEGCTSDMFSEDETYRFLTFENSNGDQLPFAVKNNCDGATLSTGVYSIATMFVVAIGMVLTSIYLKAIEVVFDEDEQTAQDYSIVVNNPPADATDATEWKQYFRKKFGVVATVCTIVTDNDDLLKNLVLRREVLQQIKSKIGPSEPLDIDNLARLASEIVGKRNCVHTMFAKVFKGVPELVAYMQVLDLKINDLAAQHRNVTTVFITFETEAAQRKVLSIMKTSEQYDARYCFREDFLDVEEPAEPSSIRWQDLNESGSKVIVRFIIPTFLTLGMIVAAAFLVREVRDYGPSYAAVTISLLNIFFPVIAKKLTNLEIHRNQGARQTSLYVKICFFRWVNTAVVTTIITPFTSTIMNGKEFLLTGVYAIFFSEIVTINLMQLIDFGGNFRRHVLAPRARTQEDLDEYMSGSVVELAERYTNMTKILFLALWYCPIYPAALFLCSFSLVVGSYVDRISLMRSWAPSPKLSSEISRINRTFFIPAAVGIMAVISSYTWTQFTFDNLCPLESTSSNYFGTWDIPSVIDGETMKTVQIDSSYQSFKFCNQNFLEYGSALTFPSLPSFQSSDSKWMTGGQERVTEAYGWSCIAILAVITIHFFLCYYRYLTRTYKPVGKDKGIPFADSNTAAYIPQVNSPEVPFPLVACPVDLIQDSLFEWTSPYHDYDYYDLTLDADAIMMGDDGGRSVSNTAFSRVVHWADSSLK